MKRSGQRSRKGLHRAARGPWKGLLIGAVLTGVPSGVFCQETGSPGDMRTGHPPATLTAWANAYLESATPGPSAGVDPLENRVHRIRAMYHLGVGDSRWVRITSDSLAAVRHSLSSPAGVQVVLAGYEGALAVLRAKHAKWPPNKLKFLGEGSRILDQLAFQHPESVEIRYLRYASYRHLPFFLSRSDTVREDLDFLVAALSQVPDALPPMLHQAAIRFILDEEKLDAAAVNRLEAAERVTTGFSEPAR